MRGQLRANTLQKYKFDEASTAADALQWLSANPSPDCMILDMHMPGMTGNALLEQLKAIKGFVPLPVIVLTGSAANINHDHSDASHALALGAQDYVTKDSIQPEALARTVYNAIERFRLTASLKEKEEQHRLAIEAAQLGTWSYEPQAQQLHCSGRCREILGLPQDDTPLDFAQFTGAVHGDHRSTAHHDITQAFTEPSGQVFRAEYRIHHDSGTPRWASLRGRVQLRDGAGPKLTGTILDISERKQSENERLQEMQMLDALYRVGQAFAGTEETHGPIQLATDIATELTRAQFGAFFYNSADSDGKFNMVYTLPNNPDAPFTNIPMPENMSLLAPIFNGEHAVRSGDITNDPQYKQNILRKQRLIASHAYRKLPCRSGYFQRRRSAWRLIFRP